MSKERELLGIINCLGHTYEHTISFFDLFVFAIFSFIIVAILLTYYSILNKKRFKNDKVQITSNKRSWFVKANVASFVLLSYVMMSPFERLINYTDVLILVSLGLAIFYLNYFHNKGVFKVKMIFKKFHMMDAPLYESNKDVLLQDTQAEGIYLANTKKLSVLAKSIVYLLIILVITMPLYQLFGLSNYYLI